MQDEDLELEKVRLIILALEFGFDEDSGKTCLNRLVELYAVESEACGALADMLGKAVRENCKVECDEDSSTCVHVIEDSPQQRRRAKAVMLDSSSDSEEMGISFASKEDVPSTSLIDPILKYEETGKSKEPLKQLGNLLLDRFKNLSGIVYCLSKSECVDVSEFLNEKCKIKTAYYHAGLASRQRVAVQERWRSGRKLEGQEGTAVPATCVILYQKNDFSRVVCMLRNGHGYKRDSLKRAMEQARKMQKYCELKTECCRKLLPEHFGESFDQNSLQEWSTVSSLPREGSAFCPKRRPRIQISSF
ncbi:hypothetical protein RND71_041180 [Anisodus tanguticus]|uniref:ATP-dependent DNA helicase RecQ zinc-binding domain-containing protein n=1 Tax=Anisodus tanguticus TaxID=243964 RepID=A0AAE1QU98_9SOLA|nr:hypothetical protein RND71_041180 [Anisodus tanguticus]